MQSLPPGFGVLVTRPPEQAEALCDLIEAAGGKAIRMPLLEIQPLAHDDESLRRLRRLDDVDWLVFVSANAVRFARAGLVPETLRARGVKVAAIGQATAEALVASGFTVDLKPKQQFNSESLLAQPELAEVAGEHFLIVRGEGGREVLAETLRLRGAIVDYVEVYRRVPARIGREPLLAHWRAGEIGAVSITSGEALEHWVRVLEENKMDGLRQTSMVVIGERLQKRACELGFSLAIAAEASDGGIFDALVRIAREVINTHQPRG